jgi:hypothetical protein
MRENNKVKLKIAGVYVFGFFVVFIVLNAFGLVLSRWLYWNPKTIIEVIFNFIINILVASFVWDIFLKWVKEIKFNYMLKESKKENTQA